MESLHGGHAKVAAAWTELRDLGSRWRYDMAAWLGVLPQVAVLLGIDPLEECWIKCCGCHKLLESKKNSKDLGDFA